MSTDAEATTTTTDANQDAVAQEQDKTQSQDAQTGGDENSQERTFNQTQMDKLLGERATRAKQATTKQILEAAGVESEKELNAIVEAHRKAQAEAMTETEKLQADMDKQKGELNAKIQEKDEAFNSLQSDHVALLTRNAVLLEAAKKEHGLSPDVFDTLLQLVDMSLLNIGDDKVVTGADKAIKQAIKDHPVLKTNGSRGSGVGSPVSGAATPSLTPATQDGKPKQPKYHL